jgi:hypothetical protein
VAYTYNSIPSVATGDVYTAAAHNNIVTNVNNYRVPPMCFTTGVNTSQTLTHAATTSIQFTGADTVDTDDIHNPSSNSDRFTVTTAGLYVATGYLQINTTGITAGLVSLNVNGTVRYENGTSSPLSASAMRMSVSGIMNLAENDIVRFNVYQESSGSVNRNPALGTFGIAWLGQAS